MKEVTLGVLLAVALLIPSISTEIPETLEWWQTTAIYDIYPRSFMDSDGDGIGDLQGIISCIKYIYYLGMGTVLLSFINESPMVDSGYDISDFRKIDPKIGTMDDFKELVETIKLYDLKLLIDIVPNHSSNEHEWFLLSVNRTEPYTDYYVWRDAAGWDGDRPVPPNNWVSIYKNGAWEWNEQRRQFYYHQFAAEQPDLNFRNRKVIEEMKEVLQFWLELGVDGFRVCAVPHLVEDALFRDEPMFDTNFTGPLRYRDLVHIYTYNQPETYNVTAELRETLDTYSKRDNKTRILLLETYTLLPSTINDTMQYYGLDEHHPGSLLPSNSLLLNLDEYNNDVETFLTVIHLWLDNMPPGRWSNWVAGNHNFDRLATRLGVEMTDAMNMLCMLLPGTSITYYGDEMGMENTYLTWEQTVDHAGRAVGSDHYLEYSRDPARTPFQWDDSANAGFTPGDTTWLPVNPDYVTKNCKQQLKDKKSHLKVFMRLVDLRSTPTIQRGNFSSKCLSNMTFVITRSLEGSETYSVVVNVGDQTDFVNVHGDDSVWVHTASINSKHDKGERFESMAQLTLPPKSALVLTTSYVVS